MRFAARLLSFIVCFELVAGGFGPAVMMSSNAYAEDCPAGTSMDTTLNRCLTSNQVASIKMAVASCNTGTTEEKQKCYENNAQSALDAKGLKGDNTNLRTKSPLLRVGSGAAIAVPLFLLSRNLFKKKEERMVCKPASLMLMYAGAGVLLGGEVITYVTHRNKLDDMNDRWKEIAIPKDGASADTKRAQQTEAQSQAFEFLAQNEESIAQTANTKFIYYASAAGLFAAGTVMAVIEKFKLHKANLTPNDPNSIVTINRIKCRATKLKSNDDKKKAGEFNEEKNKKEAEERDIKNKKDAEEAETKRRENLTPDQRKEEDDAKNKKITDSNNKRVEAKAKEIDAENKYKLAKANTEAQTDDAKKVTAKADQVLAEKKLLEAHSATLQAEINHQNLLNPNSVSSKSTTNSATSLETGQGDGLGGKLLNGAIGQAGSFIGQKNDGTQSPEYGPQTETQAKAACETAPTGRPDKKGTWTKDKECQCTEPYFESGGVCKSVPEVKINLNDLRNLKLKRTAQYNLENSTNAYELLELTKELENIEFENYSKITNYDDIDTSQFRTITFPKVFKTLLKNLDFMPEAYSQRGPVEPVSSVKPAGLVPAKTETPKAGPDMILKVIQESPTKKNAIQNAIKVAGEKIDTAIGEPLTRAALNGVFGTWIGIMSFDFKEQAEISKKRAEVLRGMRDEFASNDGITNCTDKDRNSTSKPDCYCYTAEGKRNSSRGSSSICQKIWGTFSGASAGNYQADNTKVCLDQNANMDASCSCRSQKGSDGKNTCMKAGASSFNLSGLSTGSFKMLNAGTSAAHDLVNGVLGAGQIDGAAAANNAMRIRKAADDMLKSSDPSGALTVKKLSDNIANSTLAGSAGLTMGGDSGPSLANMTPAQAVKSLDEELKKETTQNITTAGSSETIGAGNSSPEQLEFGMTQDDLAIQETQVAEVMNKDFDMDTADITKGSDTNLFEVLSNRYQRSGMRRLFDVEGKTKAEKPAASDISQ